MAQYFTDFSEYTTGQEPSDWTKYGETSRVYNVEFVSGVGNVLRGTYGGTNQTVTTFMWDSVPNHADSDVLLRMRFTEQGEDDFSIMNRATGASDAYRGDKVADQRRVSKRVTGSFTSLGSQIHPDDTAIDQGDWFWIRLRTNGSDIEVSIWMDVDPEPGSPHLTATDTSLASGQVGIGQYRNRTFEISQYSVGTAGDVAPSTDPAPSAAALDEEISASTAEALGVGPVALSPAQSASVVDTLDVTAALTEASSATAEATLSPGAVALGPSTAVTIAEALHVSSVALSEETSTTTVDPLDFSVALGAAVSPTAAASLGLDVSLSGAVSSTVEEQFGVGAVALNDAVSDAEADALQSEAIAAFDEAISSTVAGALGVGEIELDSVISDTTAEGLGVSPVLGDDVSVTEAEAMAVGAVALGAATSNTIAEPIDTGTGLAQALSDTTADALAVGAVAADPAVSSTATAGLGVTPPLDAAVSDAVAESLRPGAVALEAAVSATEADALTAVGATATLAGSISASASGQLWVGPVPLLEGISDTTALPLRPGQVRLSALIRSSTVVESLVAITHREAPSFRTVSVDRESRFVSVSSESRLVSVSAEGRTVVTKGGAGTEE